MDLLLTTPINSVNAAIDRVTLTLSNFNNQPTSTRNPSYHSIRILLIITHSSSNQYYHTVRPSADMEAVTAEVESTTVASQEVTIILTTIMETTILAKQMNTVRLKNNTNLCWIATVTVKARAKVAAITMEVFRRLTWMRVLGIPQRLEVVTIISVNSKYRRTAQTIIAIITSLRG